MPILRTNYRRHSLLTIFFSIIPLFVVGATNYIVDPLQVYRKQQFNIPMFWWNQRAQNAGKIRSYLSSDGYDSILVGNSVADNFRSSQITNYLGWEKVMKLTVDGGHASEQAFMVEKALQGANIKRVLWVIRTPSFLSRQEEGWHKTRQIPFYLYTKERFDDIPYILSFDNFRFSLSQLLITGKVGRWESDLEWLNYWMLTGQSIERLIQYNSQQNLTKLNTIIKEKNCRFKLKPREKYPAVDHNILRIITEFPDIEYILLIAPTSRQKLASSGSQYLSRYFGFQKYLVSKTSNLLNVRLYGFENLNYIVDNLANYRDAIHYHSGVNNEMLKSIANEHCRLTSVNIDDYISEISNKLCSFSIKSDFLTMIPLALHEERVLLSELLLKSK